MTNIIKITEEMCLENIKSETYWSPDGLLTTVCVLVLENDFEVVGISNCMSVDTYDEQLGKKYAKQDAINKIYPLLAFKVKDVEYEHTLLDETLKAWVTDEVLERASKLTIHEHPKHTG